MADWFAPKRYGYGAGLPIAWQGLVLLIGYLLLVVAASLLLPHSVAGFLGVVTVLTAFVLIISARRTRGGWRWRWGTED